MKVSVICLCLAEDFEEFGRTYSHIQAITLKFCMHIEIIKFLVRAAGAFLIECKLYMLYHLLGTC